MGKAVTWILFFLPLPHPRGNKKKKKKKKISNKIVNLVGILNFHLQVSGQSTVDKASSPRPGQENAKTVGLNSVIKLMFREYVELWLYPCLLYHFLSRSYLAFMLCQLDLLYWSSFMYLLVCQFKRITSETSVCLPSQEDHLSSSKTPTDFDRCREKATPRSPSTVTEKVVRK